MSGDQVLEIGEVPLETLDEYRMVRLAMRPGQVSNLKVRRGARTLSIPIQAWDKTDGLLY